MLLPLKRHAFKKLSNISIYYTNIVQTFLKFFLSQGYWGDSPVSQAPGSHLTQPRSKQIKMALGHLYWDQEELFGGKTYYKNSRETVPLSR